MIGDNKEFYEGKSFFSLHGLFVALFSPPLDSSLSSQRNFEFVASEEFDLIEGNKIRRVSRGNCEG